MQIKHPIIINNLYSAYNEKTNAAVVAIKNFSYKFEANKIYCIIGESGSGKSTLINYFNGLFKPTYGSLTINNIELNGKYNLNNIFLEKYKISHINKISFLHNSMKFDKDKNYFIIKVPYNAREQEVKLKLISFNPNNRPVLSKLSIICLNVLKINPKLKNRFYIVESENTLDDIPSVANLSDFSNDPISCTSDSFFSNKRIKKFKIIRRNVGMVYQFPEYQLFKNTVIEDVMFGPRNLGFNKIEAKQMAIDSLEKLNITEKFYTNSPFGLSGGQKRRVAIAGILSIGGSILIFDEPTAGLDPRGEDEMIEIMLNAKKEGKTIFVVTHSMNEVLKIADEILVLHNGELVANGSPYKVFNNKKIMQETSISIPYIVNLVNELVKKDSRYESLINLEPRTIEQLGDYILQLRKADNVTNI